MPRLCSCADIRGKTNLSTRKSLPRSKRGAATPRNGTADCGMRTDSVDLLIVGDYSRCGCNPWELVAHFLDLRDLLFEARRKNLNRLLLLRDGRCLLCVS